MLYYLTEIEPYYITCITDDSFKPKTAEGLPKPEAQLSNNERRVANQDQCLKSVIISCLPVDILELVINFETTKEWTDLVHNCDGSSHTKENRIMDLKVKYNTFRAKDSESLSQTFTHYKSLLNKLTNDGVKLSKHEINVVLFKISKKILMTRVLMALSDEENLTVGKNHARNGEWVNFTMRKVNIILSMDEDVD
ncbi:hypothetical protein Tco_1186768 [Tanacetum coccineum]